MASTTKNFHVPGSTAMRPIHGLRLSSPIYSAQVWSARIRRTVPRSSVSGGAQGSTTPSRNLDTLRKSLAEQVHKDRLQLWEGDLDARKAWMARGEQSASLKGCWQDEYAGLLAVVADVSRRKVAFTAAEADRIIEAARGRHGPDSLEFGRAAGAAGVALLVGMRPGWQKSAPPLLAAARRVHEAWLGPRHCAVFLLGSFHAASEALKAAPRHSAYNEAAVKRRLDAAVQSGGPSGPELGAALAEGGLALMLSGRDGAGRAMLRRAAGVHGAFLGPSHPVPSICRALSNDALLWGPPSGGSSSSSSSSSKRKR